MRGPGLIVRDRLSGGLATRLLLAQALVLVAGAGTAWLVASAVGPGIFHGHLLRAGVDAGHTTAETAHVEKAFASALIVALGVALAASVVAALAVTGYFTRRIQRSIAAVAHSASQIAEGRYRSRVPNPGLGLEFDQLAGTINELAKRLGDVEVTRRRILADLAHEMRTPLATIEAYLEAIEDGVRVLDKDTLAVLHGGTQRLRRLAEDVGAVSLAEEGLVELRPTVVSPRRLLESAAATARESYDHRHVGLVATAAPTPNVRVDPERLAQVLANLLENALRHTPPGGVVTLSATAPDEKWVELSVTDTGTGITPEHLGHIFERFYRADPARTRAYAGSGIGLTISRAIVEAHGGALSATSAGTGKGATLTMRLPAWVTVTAGQAPEQLG